MNVHKKSNIRYLTMIVMTAVVIVFIIMSSLLREIIYLIFISFLIAYTLKPIYNSMLNKGINKRISAFFLISLLILLVISTFAILIPSLFKESLNLKATAGSIQSMVDNFYMKLKPVQDNKTIYALIVNLNSKIDSGIMNICTRIFDSLMYIGQNLLSIIVIPIITYYFLADGECINGTILSIFPMSSRNIIEKVCCHADKILGRYIMSQLILSALVGIATFFILVVLKVDFPIILSVLNAFFNIIPYFGPIFGALPAIVIAIIKSPRVALWTAIWLYILQQVEGNILSPKVTGDSISMHPLVIILLLIIGGKAAGFIGMILAVPIGVIIKILYEDLNYYLF
ncbi:AI-2E family transporter [Clostridium sp. Mt-5]|uniref:AI-2E family transporter n=1 Tax=Clostridium moutaii TaxID=3240932 RepID=A0ABV4BRT7_9CLOT